MQRKITMEKQLDIDEVIQLSHIREVRDIFALKIEELKAGGTRELIEDYLEKKNKCRRMLFEDVLKNEKKKKKKKKRKRITAHEEEPSLYWFVLTRYRGWTWQVTEIEPEPPSYEKCLGILPEDIMGIMADDSEVDPDRIHSPNPLYSRDSRCFYDIRYVRFSTNNIFGVVRENLYLTNKKYAKYKVPRAKRMEAALGIFFHCITEYPRLARMFIDGMFEKALPYLAAEEELKEANAHLEQLSHGMGNRDTDE